MAKKTKKKIGKKPTEQIEKTEVTTEGEDTLGPYLTIFEDTWKEDHSEFLYSGTAVSSSTTDVAIGEIFKDDKKYVEEWKEKRKEKKFCPFCKRYFPSFLSHCPNCMKKIE